MAGGLCVRYVLADARSEAWRSARPAHMCMTASTACGPAGRSLQKMRSACAWLVRPPASQSVTWRPCGLV